SDSESALHVRSRTAPAWGVSEWPNWAAAGTVGPAAVRRAASGAAGPRLAVVVLIVPPPPQSELQRMFYFATCRSGAQEPGAAVFGSVWIGGSNAPRSH